MKVKEKQSFTIALIATRLLIQCQPIWKLTNIWELTNLCNNLFVDGNNLVTITGSKTWKSSKCNTFYLFTGQERYGNMTRVYYKEAVGAFIVFDVTRKNTFDSVMNWKSDLDYKVQLPDGSPIPCVLLANKVCFSLEFKATHTHKHSICDQIIFLIPTV